VYDAEIGRFLQADPNIQAPTNSQNYNRYSYVLNNPMSYTDPSGYFFKSLFRAIGEIKGLSTVISVVLNVIPGCAMWCSAVFNAAMSYSLTGSLRGAVIGAVASYITPGGGSWGAILTSAAIGGVSAKLQGGKFGHGFITAGVGGSMGSGVGKGWVKVLSAAVVGGTISKLTGGKFANGAFSAAFAAAMATDWGRKESGATYSKGLKSKVLANKSMSGKASSLFGGKVEVTKWGFSAGEVSDADLATVKNSLDDIFGADDAIQSRLSSESPLKIILNDIGENFAEMNGNVMTVDIHSDIHFYDLSLESPVLVPFSATRKIAHEIGHAVMGIDDDNNKNVIYTDTIMKSINKTQSQREQYSNACQASPMGGCM